jgi:hypothetical protein
MLRNTHFCFVLLIVPISICAQTAQSIHAGLERMEWQANSAIDGSIEFYGVRVDPRQLTVKLLDTYGLLGTGDSFSGFSLRDLVMRVDALAIINGGPTASYTSPVPVGLLLIDGKVRSKPAASSKALTGIICFAGADVSVLPLSAYGVAHCSSALQAGPIIIKASSNAVYPNERSERRGYRRSIAALDTSGRILLLTTNVAHLYEVARCLLDSSNRLQVRDAINLDGDSSSGIIVGQAENARREIGSTASLIASAIAVVAERTAAPRTRGR